MIVQNWYNASDALQHEKTWFWWADKQKKEAVRQRKASEREARAVLRKHEKHIQVAMNLACITVACSHSCDALLAVLAAAGALIGTRRSINPELAREGVHIFMHCRA